MEECKAVVSKAVDKFGQLDVLVNAAGILTGGGIENLSLEDYDKQMNVNARALFVTTQAAVPHLKNSKGNIVNVSSITGLRAVNFHCYILSASWMKWTLSNANGRQGEHLWANNLMTIYLYMFLMDLEFFNL